MGESPSVQSLVQLHGCHFVASYNSTEFFDFSTQLGNSSGNSFGLPYVFIGFFEEWRRGGDSPCPRANEQ